MNKLTTAIVIVSSLNLTACVTWPVLGSGGAAEHTTASSPMNDTSNQTITPEQGLYFELELVKRHLDIMVLEGAEYCFPATVVQARNRQNRIIRELHGGLELDAANDLIIQRELLLRLERQLDYVSQERVCIPPSDESVWVSEKQIENLAYLLNSGQQFEVDSDVLTDSYTGQLAEASFLLRDLDRFAIHITGHINTVGDKDKQALSLSRTEMIQRYLMVFGIKPDHIHINEIDSNNPIFEKHIEGDNDAASRVTIELVELQSRIANAGE